MEKVLEIFWADRPILWKGGPSLSPLPLCSLKGRLLLLAQCQRAAPAASHAERGEREGRREGGLGGERERGEAKGAFYAEFLSPWWRVGGKGASTDDVCKNLEISPCLLVTATSLNGLQARCVDNPIHVPLWLAAFVLLDWIKPIQSGIETHTLTHRMKFLQARSQVSQSLPLRSHCEHYI